MRSLFRNTWFVAATMLIVGILLGGIFFGNNAKDTTPEKVTQSEDKETIWTCSMHPQIRQNEPGKCPICGMDLIPVNEMGAGPDMVQMTESAAKLANIITSEVSFTLPEKEIILQGKVKMDETRVSNQTAHIPGRIERLFVDFTGEKVSKGQKLASVYAPKLVTSQKELLEAAKLKDTHPMLYKAARNKLKQWKLSTAQIDAIEKSGQVKEEIDILADMSGVVLERNVAVGDYVKEGGVLFALVDLNRVWVVFDAYEADLPWLNEGDKIQFQIGAIPGKTFEAPISFIDPVINPKTRTAEVRVKLTNANHSLKPEMFARGTILAKLPIDEAQLTVPKSAVLWTGKRSVVYLKVPHSEKPLYQFKQVTLGHDLGGYYIVKEGLKKGDEIVANGAFKVDAAAQLAGKKSMMNQHVAEDASQMQMSKSENTKESKLFVYGNCAMCKDRIENAAQAVKGVQHATWNKDSKMLTMHYDSTKVNVQKVEIAVVKAGHDTKNMKAQKKIYKELPECCKYSRK